MHLPNLLPAEDKKVYKVYLFLLYLRKFLIFQILTATLVLTALGSYYYLLSYQLKSLQQETQTLSQVQKKIDIQALQKVADEHNERLKAAAAVLKIKIGLFSYVDEVARLVPDGVTLDTLEVNSANNILDIRGRAVNREKVVLFQNSLETSENLQLVFAPLSNLTEIKDPTFQFIVRGQD